MLSVFPNYSQYYYIREGKPRCISVYNLDNVPLAMQKHETQQKIII